MATHPVLSGGGGFALANGSASANGSIGNGSIGKQTTENWFSTIPTCDGKRTKPNRVRSSRVGASRKEAISFIFLFLSPTGDFGVSQQCGQKKDCEVRCMPQRQHFGRCHIGGFWSQMFECRVIK